MPVRVRLPAMAAQQRRRLEVRFAVDGICCTGRRARARGGGRAAAVVRVRRSHAARNAIGPIVNTARCPVCARVPVPWQRRIASDGMVHSRKRWASRAVCSFDRVFGPAAKQDEVFEDLVPLVTYVLPLRRRTVSHRIHVCAASTVVYVACTVACCMPSRARPHATPHHGVAREVRSCVARAAEWRRGAIRPMCAGRCSMGTTCACLHMGKRARARRTQCRHAHRHVDCLCLCVRCMHACMHACLYIYLSRQHYATCNIPHARDGGTILA
jgi:hypothetical protein